jgi:hypothetical protein
MRPGSSLLAATGCFFDEDGLRLKLFISVRIHNVAIERGLLFSHGDLSE